MPANATSSDRPVDRRPIDHKPRVVVTRHLMPSVEQRMCELFDTTLNREDIPLTRARLIAAMQAADGLVPTVTDRIDADMIERAGDRLRLIANFVAATEHIDLAPDDRTSLASGQTESVRVDLGVVLPFTNKTYPT